MIVILVFFTKSRFDYQNGLFKASIIANHTPVLIGVSVSRAFKCAMGKLVKLPFKRTDCPLN
jgi:hypothetical protein